MSKSYRQRTSRTIVYDPLVLPIRDAIDLETVVTDWLNVCSDNPNRERVQEVLAKVKEYLDTQARKHDRD
jgi:hypothetical protein